MNNIKTFDTSEMMCEAAAEFIIDLATKSIRTNGKFTIALSGGSTPKKLYEILGTHTYSERLDWKSIYVFWGDERYVPASESENNSNMAFESLLHNVAIPVENIFPIPVHFSPAKAAISYEETLKSFFKATVPGFDLILLGIGSDGHTASLFPYSDILKEQNQIVKEVFVDEVNMYRITFTAKLINNAKTILFLASGKDKAEIIKTIFREKKQPDKYPVELIKPINGEAVWYLDTLSASLLKK